MLSLVNQIRRQIVAIKGTFGSLLVKVMKMSLLAQSKHIDRLCKSPSHSGSVRRGTCAEVEVVANLVSASLFLLLDFTVVSILLSWSILSRIFISSHTEVIMCLQKEPGSEAGYGNEAGS